MGYRVPPFFRCSECERLHTRTGVWPDSVCACGVKLWPQVWGAEPVDCRSK